MKLQTCRVCGVGVGGGGGRRLMASKNEDKAGFMGLYVYHCANVFQLDGMRQHLEEELAAKVTTILLLLPTHTLNNTTIA